MDCEAMSPVERVAALLEGVEAGHVAVADLASIGDELVGVLADLAAEPAGWVADLGRALQATGIGEPPARRAAGYQVTP